MEERDDTGPRSGNDQLLMVLGTKCQDLKDLIPGGQSSCFL